MSATIYCLCNQKGGCAKTVSSISIGIGLAREGRSVLLVDVDSQGSMTASLGYQQPDQMETTLSAILGGKSRTSRFRLEAGFSTMRRVLTCSRQTLNWPAWRLPWSTP